MNPKRYDFFIRSLKFFIPPGTLLKFLMPSTHPIEPSGLKSKPQTLNIFPNMKTLNRVKGRKVLKSKKSILNIAKGQDSEFYGLFQSLGFPFNNLKKINVFEEGNPSYRSFYKKNRYSWLNDPKTFLNLYRDVFDCEVSYVDSDVSPSVESYLEKVKTNDYQKFFKSNSIFLKEGESGGTKVVKSCLKGNKKLSVFLPSKGVGHLFCRTCKKNTQCPICKKTLTLYKYELKCLDCDDSWPKISRCDVCGSKLHVLRQGVDYFYNWFLNEGFLHHDIEVVSSEKKPKEIKDSLGSFKKGFSKVLLTTDFEFLRDDFGQKVIWIPYLRHLFLGDDFRSYENGWWKIHAINSFCFKKGLDLFLGSKGSSLFPVKCFEKGEFSKFYRDEIEARKQFDYPPFGEILMIVSERKIKNSFYNDLDLEDLASDTRFVRVFDSRGKEKNHFGYIFQSRKIEESFKKFVKDLILKNENIRIYYEGSL